MENRLTASEQLTKQLAGLSPAKRALLELRLLKKRPAGIAPRSISHQPSDEPAPLSYNQQGLWVLNQLMPGTSLYHTPIVARLRGNLDESALRASLNLLLARHDALRTSFVTIDDEPSQIVAERVTLELPVIDVSARPANERETAAQQILEQQICLPFKLSEGPLVRAVLVRVNEVEHILLVTMHHIVTDGWSVGIFQQELSICYQAFSSGQSPTLPELPIIYSDYSHWQRQWLKGPLYLSQLSYWKKQFATLPPVLELPTDYPRPHGQDARVFRSIQQSISLPSQLTADLKALAQQQGVTLFMALLAAYKILLHRYSGADDIVVGTPIAGRQMPETENLIGLFINTLALRTSLDGDLTCHEVLARVRDAALGAFAHQELPFERLVKELQPERSLAHNPLFQAMFVLQSEQIEPLELPGLATEHFRVAHTMANFDLTLDVAEREGQLQCMFEANADLFKADSLGRLLTHFSNLITGLVANPASRISQLPLLSATERHQLLVERNETKTAYPSNKCIHKLFEELAGKTPEAVALLSVQGQVSYRTLNEQSNQFAHYLRKHGVEVGTRVGVCLQRSPDMIVALLGILKAGGAYVPIDADYPEARLQFMIKDAQVRVLLAQEKLLPKLPVNTAEIICLDRISQILESESTSNLELEMTAENLAYVMYTSGSTGQPKGVAVTHRNVVRLVRNTNYASFSADEVFLQCATISFDASTFEIWGSLLNGARLALMAPGSASLGELGQAIKRYQVTTLWLTAGLFNLMVEHHLDDLRNLRQLLAGGDVLSVPHVQKVLAELPNCRLINGYGPTENTTFTCCYTVTDTANLHGSVPIGRPISNTTVYILDPGMNPVPVGVSGELYVGGDGVASGYLGRPELNAERFVVDPFSDNPASRLYRTGDLVRYRADSEIEFIGRLDNQVKVRGFRIELGEIESVLAQHPHVGEAVVVARKDGGDKHLAAYLVPRAGATPVIEEVRDFVRGKLPEHMLPSVFTLLESIPLTASGKVDRRALPAIDEKQGAMTGFAAPVDELELKLTNIWEKVLDIRSVGVHDNFFDLGGHSLLAVRLFAQIERAFNRNLPLATLFQAPTVRQLARVLREDGWPTTWSSLVVIQGGRKRTPLFCIHAVGGNVLEYHDLARHLGPDQPFYGLQARGLDGKAEPHTSIKEMASHYIKEMMEVQPEGPYMLAGRSSGGTVAFEMACQLAAKGDTVSLLALLDTYPVGYFKLLPQSGSANQRLDRFGRKMKSHAENLSKLNGGQRVAYVLQKLKYGPAKIKHKLYRRMYKLYQRFGQPLPAVLRNIEEITFAAVKDYLPQTYAGNVTLFLASDLTGDYDLKEGWRELVQGRIEVHDITGNHIDIVKEPHVRGLAEKLSDCIARVQVNHANEQRAA